MTLQANNTLLLQNDSLGSHCESWYLQSSPITFTVGHGLQNKPYFWVVKYIYMQTVKQKVWSEASFFSHLHALSECEACRICMRNSDAMPVLQIVEKKDIWEKDWFFCISFRLRSLANVMDGSIPIPHQHPVEWTSLSLLLTWQTHAAVAATPLVPTYHTYMTSQKMNLIDCCAW